MNSTSYSRFKNALIQLVKSYKKIKKENENLKKEISFLKEEISHLKEENLQLKSELDSFRVQNLLPVEEYETLLNQLDQYIADIDFCLTLISQSQRESDGR